MCHFRNVCTKIHFSFFCYFPAKIYTVPILMILKSTTWDEKKVHAIWFLPIIINELKHPGLYSKWLYFSLKRLLFRPGSWRCVGTMSGGLDNSDHLHPHHHYFLYNNHHRHHDYRFSPPIVMFRPGPALLLVSSDAPTPRSQFLAHYSFTSIKVWSLWGLHDDINDVNDDTTSVKAPLVR